MVASHLVSSADRLRAFSFMLQEDRPQHWSTNDPIATRQILTTGKKKKKTHEVNPSSVAVAICCFFFLTVDRTQRWDWKNEKKKQKTPKESRSFLFFFFFFYFILNGRSFSVDSVRSKIPKIRPRRKWRRRTHDTTRMSQNDNGKQKARDFNKKKKDAIKINDAADGRPFDFSSFL